jgi:hypothetical protein
MAPLLKNHDKSLANQFVTWSFQMSTNYKQAVLLPTVGKALHIYMTQGCNKILFKEVVKLMCIDTRNLHSCSCIRACEETLKQCL